MLWWPSLQNSLDGYCPRAETASFARLRLRLRLRVEVGVEVGLGVAVTVTVISIARAGQRNLPWVRQSYFAGCT